MKIDKQEQRSNWQIRPLTENQIKYALFDVEFLYENLPTIFINYYREIIAKIGF